MKAKKNIFILLSLLFVVQVNTNGQEEDNKTLDGIGKYVIGKTTYELFNGVKVKDARNKSKLSKGVYLISSSSSHKIEGHKEYKHIGYKVNDKIIINLRFFFFNDTLYYIDAKSHFVHNGVTYSPEKRNNLGALFRGLNQAGYISEESEENTRKPYINMFGGVYYSYYSAKNVTYKSKPNIHASGSSSSVDNYAVLSFSIMNLKTQNRVSVLEKQEMNKKPLPNKDLIKGL